MSEQNTLPPIDFFVEDIDFALPNPTQTADWIANVVDTEGGQLEELTYVFCSDEYLHKINLEYLDHDTYTDIITFDNSEDEEGIVGDIFISIDRVRENAQQLQVPFEQELHRVLIHGVLHLLGYPDKTEAEAQAMRQKEDQCLALRFGS
ncbi:rRNA maturation RNase YbeY [Eisenibacter elegans]|jgi:rRNA maturation RNase YbeY|uniref:rRNA maturation RNase YbeY n=1 Tax=Eisenibacter elegans TaxID=997 RepID=UPI000427D78B|nr:rRNA maturation RNase YbeY [Eisenibacter elegans]